MLYTRNGSFEVAIHDTGRDFNPAVVPAPNMKEYLARYRRGGLGMYLMRSLMDEVKYDILPGKRNVVRLIKHLSR